MRNNLKTILLLLLAFVAAQTALFAQNMASQTSSVTEGELMVTILSDQIIRVQKSITGAFAETPMPEQLAAGSDVQVARHEDRLRIESPWFTFVHIPQKGISSEVSPHIITPRLQEKVFLLSAEPMQQDIINKGVLIIDNKQDRFFPVANTVEADRILVFTNNNYDNQIEFLKELSGKDVEIKEACKTPQVYFKPVKGSAMLQIESSHGATIYFTRDGSTPTYNSEVYQKSQLLKTSARVVAFATDDVHMPSPIAEAQIVMSKARDISWRHEYSPEYCGLGEYALMDGINGDPEDYRRNWIGIPGNDMSVEVELNRPMALSMLGIRFFQQPEEGIFIPERVTIEVSCDGRKYHKVYKHRIKTPDAPYHHWTHNITARFRAREVKYIRIYAEENDDFHAEDKFLAGKKWIFVDEIDYEQHPDKEGVTLCREKK